MACGLRSSSGNAMVPLTTARRAISSFSACSASLFGLCIKSSSHPHAPAPRGYTSAHDANYWRLPGLLVVRFSAIPDRSTFLVSPGFGPNLGSGCEPERLHFIGVLSFDDEFREDVAVAEFRRNSGMLWRRALAQPVLRAGCRAGWCAARSRKHPRRAAGRRRPGPEAVHPRESGDPARVPGFRNVTQSQFSACRLPAPRSAGGQGLLLGFLGKLVIPQQANSRLRCPFPNSRASGGDWITSPFAGMTRGSLPMRQMILLFGPGILSAYGRGSEQSDAAISRQQRSPPGSR